MLSLFSVKEQFDFNNKLFKVEDTDSIIVQDYSTGNKSSI